MAMRGILQYVIGAPFLVAVLAATAQSEPAEQRAVLVDESPFRARLAGIDAQWNITFALTDKQRVVPGGEVVYWGAYRDSERGPQTVLTDGSILRADLLELSAQRITLGDATGLGRGVWDETTLDRALLRGILLQPPADDLARDKLLQRVRDYREADDLLLLASGETISGILIEGPRPPSADDGASPERSDNFRLSRSRRAQPLAVPAAKVTALLFGALGRSQRSSAQASAAIGTRDGSLLSVDQIEVKDRAVQLTLACGATLTAPLDQADDLAPTFWDQINWLQPRTAGIAFLSELQPIGYKHVPFLSLEWPYGTDRSALGGRLRSGDFVIPKGLGMHSASRLAYSVEGYRRFDVEVALDAASGTRGSVVFKVLLETEPGQWSSAHESPVVRGGDGPLPFSVDLNGARRMALIVDFADRGDELDHANWLMPRLVK
jgi:hypothetical protein